MKKKGIFLPFGALAGYFSVIIMSLLLSPCAEAQGKSSQNGEYYLEKMTVTAQKQKENIQEVPVSVTAISGVEIEDKNIDGIWELMDHVPGLMNFDVGMSDFFSQPSMRGISAPASTLNSAVGLFIDGVPVFSAPGFTASMIDIERVEVLRGPQGTLYGKNTEAGAINIITRQPDNELRLKVGTKIGTNNKRVVWGTASGPLVEDKLFLSLTGQYDEKDGFLENDYLGGHDDDRERYYGRAQLRWTPSADWDISLFASRQAANEGVSAQAANAYMRGMFGLPPLPERTTYSGLRPEREGVNDLESLKISYDINESLSLTSITARKMTDWDEKTDYDYSPLDIYHEHSRGKYSNLSQEIRLNWEFDRFKGVMGLYGDITKNDIDVGNILADESEIPTTDRKINGRSYAAYGQLDYSLTKALHVIAGLRYEEQKMDYEDNLLLIDTSKTWRKATPKFGLSYQFSPNINAYATVAQGYRTGGFNRTSADPEYISFDPEELWNYEVGIKTSFLDNRLIANASVYYMSIENMQVEEAVTPGTTYVTNAAEATSKGCEIEITAKPFKGLTLNAGFAYIDATFDDFEDADGDYSGNTNPFAPEYTYNLGAVYRHSSGLFLSMDLLGYGETYLDKANTAKRDAYELVNAKVGFETEHFDIYLYAENLFDKDYDSLGYYGFYNNYSPPRELGVQLTYRF